MVAVVEPALKHKPVEPKCCSAGVIGHKSFFASPRTGL